jgi:hypothetical protein
VRVVADDDVGPGVDGRARKLALVHCDDGRRVANAFVERYRQHVDSGLQRGDVVHHCSSVPGSANV